MKREKMSLDAIQGKLSRAEMKEIMAGSGGTEICYLQCNGSQDVSQVNVCDMPTLDRCGGPIDAYCYCVS